MKPKIADYFVGTLFAKQVKLCFYNWTFRKLYLLEGILYLTLLYQTAVLWLNLEHTFLRDKVHLILLR